MAFSGSPQPTHAVDTTATFDRQVCSLATHRVDLENLSGDMSAPDSFLRVAAEAAGAEFGVDLAATFEVVR